jgi:hypothetical protein
MSAPSSICTGNDNLGADIGFDPTKLSAPQIRSLLEHLCDTLVLRREILPQSITFQPRQPPTLLNLPREIRNRIYEFSCPSTLEQMRAEGHSGGYTLHLQKVQALQQPAKKRRPASKAITVPLEQSTSFMPPVWIKFNGSIRFHEPRKVCSPKHDRLVTEVFANNAVGVKIDLTNETSLPNDDFLERVFPDTILKAVHVLNIEVYVSVAVWEGLCMALSKRLSKLSFKSQCILRAFAICLDEETNNYVLENFRSGQDIVQIRQQKTAYFKKMAQDTRSASMVLMKLPRSHQIQLLFAPLRRWHVSLNPYSSRMIEFAAVQKRFGSEWKSFEGGMTDVLGMGSFLRVVDHDVVDL